ncbi:MAG: hypothetical protein DHS20C10_02770 [marine bacterium B5-7]|nr:MAG: hypothetical protein DHS20C10_02770 [marine bacterium B5-7]
MSAPTLVTLSDLLRLQEVAKHLGAQALNQETHALRGGAFRSKRRGRGMDFDEVRLYQPGDDSRHMDWRVTARTQTPHVKVYREEKERPLWLWIDLSPSAYFGTRRAFKSVALCELAAIFAWSAIQRQDKVGAVVVYDNDCEVFPAKAREAAVLPLLKSLANCSAQTPKETSEKVYRAALQRFQQLHAGDGQNIFLSDGYAVKPSWQTIMHQLNRTKQGTFMQVYDPIEVHPPKVGDYTFTDGEAVCHVGTRTNTQKTAYQQAFTGRQEVLEELLRKVKMPLWHVSTQQLPQQALLRYWKR